MTVTRLAGRLVAADLDAVAGVAVMVGRVHDPGGQPQDALLDLVQHLRAGVCPRCYHASIMRRFVVVIRSSRSGV
jgi:hypothetical protein